MTPSRQVLDTLERINFRCLAGLSGLMFVALFIPKVNVFWLTSKMLAQQDVWILALYVFLSGWILRSSGLIDRPIQVDGRRIVIFCLIILVLCYLGHLFILSGYDLSRDEQMANFDASIFAHGRLVWPLPRDWQINAAALNLEFMLPVDRPAAWSSAYLPMNAALRAAVGVVVDRNLTGPLLTAASLPLIWSIANRIWPSDREASTLAMLMLAGSGQFMIIGMTAYAMPAHLFFNLLWLRLFVVNRRWTDGLALIVAFIATGLHQPLFHPMFAAPFLLLTVLDRHWWRAGMFAVGYAMIGAFWLSWPMYIQGLIMGPDSTAAAAGIDYVSRLNQILSLTLANPTLTAANLLRFVVWQHLLLLPFLVIGLRVVRRDRLGAMLALSLAMPIVVMAIILPYQGIGFGYRYLHGVLGNAVLLSVYGWRELKASHAELRPMLLKATAASALLLLPLQAWMAHARYAPSARASAQIDGSGADYVLVEAMGGPLVQDFVINRPDLSNRPVRLVVEAIDDMPALARGLCHPGVKVAFGTDAFYAPSWAYFGDKPRRSIDAELGNLRKPFDRAGCRTILLN